MSPRTQRHHLRFTSSLYAPCGRFLHCERPPEMTWVRRAARRDVCAAGVSPCPGRVSVISANLSAR